jgi:hypothetical protein
MPYVTLPTAVVGAIVPASWGNQARDNLEYLKGNAGPVTIGNAVAVTGAVSSTSNVTASGNVTAAATVTGTGSIVAGPSASNQITWHDRNSNVPWLWYAAGNTARLYYGATGIEPIRVGVAGDIELAGGIVNQFLTPPRMHPQALFGFWSGVGGTVGMGIAYNGDGTVNYMHVSSGTINFNWAVTFEYSGGLVVAMRLRAGGPGGAVSASITFGYTGSQVTSIFHS